MGIEEPRDKPKRRHQTQAQIARVIAAAASAGRILSEALAQPDGSVRLVFHGPQDPSPSQPVVDTPAGRKDQRQPGAW